LRHFSEACPEELQQLGSLLAVVRSRGAPAASARTCGLRPRTRTPSTSRSG
jgi:hypothetical protein